MNERPRARLQISGYVKLHYNLIICEFGKLHANLIDVDSNTRHE